MVAVTDQNQRIPLFGELYRFHVDFGDQGTGRVNHAQSALLAGLAHFG